MISKPMTKKKDSKENKRTEIDDMKQPQIAEKEYIVFRFREDGGIDLAEEKSLTSNSDTRIDHIHHDHKVFD